MQVLKTGKVPGQGRYSITIPKKVLKELGWRHRTILMFRVDIFRKQLTIERCSGFVTGDIPNVWCENHRKPAKKKEG